MTKNKTTFFAATVLAVAGMLASASPAYAQVYGKVISIAGDKDGYQVELSQAGGPCKNKIFYMYRSQPNYKEFVASAMVAYSNGKGMNVFPSGTCETPQNRSVLTHGFGVW